MKRIISIILIVGIITISFAIIPTSAAQSLGTPKITSFANNAKGIRITWQRITNADKYRVFVKSGKHWKSLGDTSGTTWTDKNVKSNTMYTYTVRCISKDGRRYTSSYNKNGWKHLYLSAPTGLRSKSTESIILNWNKVAGAGKYIIERYIGKSWEILGTTTKTQYSTIGDDNITYSFRVIAVSTDGKSFSPVSSTHSCSYAFIRKGAARFIWNRLIQEGFSKYAAAGVLGNIMAECGSNGINLRPYLYSNSGNNYGILMWALHMYPDIKNQGLSGQLKLLLSDMPKRFQKFGDRYQKGYSFNEFKKTSNAAEAGIAFSKCYLLTGVRPSSYYTQISNNALMAYQKFA